MELVTKLISLWFRLFLCVTAQVETGNIDGGKMLVVNKKEKNCLALREKWVELG